ncbi:hypothetical protein HPP92_019380 [Vanilla planifolia]|uniref:Uncharacterized protein n=1 Tax=Vanilla planifolia TaxID=51239 RepID=A0A835Q2S0_VANPL|nr:hypothetical protein HPP92_019380 [Vanilla planifolia]
MPIICMRRAYSRKTQWSISILSGFTRRGFSVGVSGGSSNSNEKNEVMPSITTKNEECDIAAIVGGGMVGLALACGLSNMQLAKQLSVAIIDSNPAVKSRANFKKSEVPDPRVSTVTPATISFLKEVGAWGMWNNRGMLISIKCRYGITLVWAIQGIMQEMLTKTILDV